MKNLLTNKQYDKLKRYAKIKSKGNLLLEMAYLKELMLFADNCQTKSITLNEITIDVISTLVPQKRNASILHENMSDICIEFVKYAEGILTDKDIQ